MIIVADKHVSRMIAYQVLTEAPKDKRKIDKKYLVLVSMKEFIVFQLATNAVVQKTIIKLNYTTELPHYKIIRLTRCLDRAIFEHNNYVQSLVRVYVHE